MSIPIPPWYPHKCSLQLCLHFCFANKITYAIFQIAHTQICHLNRGVSYTVGDGNKNCWVGQKVHSVFFIRCLWKNPKGLFGQPYIFKASSNDSEWLLLETQLFRVPWTARISNQSILKEINTEYSLKGLRLKLRRQYFVHLMRRPDSLEKTAMLERLKAGEGDDSR